MDYNYPILKNIFNHYNKLPHRIGDIFLVGCQHLLEPQMKMIECLIEFGFDPKKINILGKAYSTNFDILDELNSLGVNAIQPKFSGVNFDEEHKNNCRMLFNLVPQGAKSIILDDGAELIKLFAESDKDVIFCVEQTSSGFRKLKNENLPFPVFNVARSVTKLSQESPLVARHLCQRILDYARDKEIINPNIFIVGLGPIGESILEVFRENNLTAAGFDVKYGHHDLLKKISSFNPNIIIGATGLNILTKEDLDNISLGHKIFLISASSSDREFPVAFCRHNEGTHDDVLYNDFIFVNNGFPFSFIGNRYEMTPLEIEKTICLLSGSIMHGITRNNLSSGLIDIPDELEDLVNKVI